MAYENLWKSRFNPDAALAVFNAVISGCEKARHTGVSCGFVFDEIGSCLGAGFLIRAKDSCWNADRIDSDLSKKYARWNLCFLGLPHSSFSWSQSSNKLKTWNLKDLCSMAWGLSPIHAHWPLVTSDYEYWACQVTQGLMASATDSLAPKLVWKSASIHLYPYKVGPLPVVNGVITRISRVIRL